MKTKTILIISACVLAAAFILGASGVAGIGQGGEAQGMGGDRLIGVLVTDERTDPFGDEGFLWDDMESMVNGERSDTAQGRIYGKMIDRVDYAEDGSPIHSKEYVFENTPGVFFYVAMIDDANGEPYRASSGDEGITGSAININASDSGEEVSCLCTVLISEDSGIELSANPVYRTPGGEIYALPGGTVMTSSDCADITVTYDDVFTVQSGAERHSDSFKVSVTAKVVPVPQKITVAFMDGEDSVLVRAGYNPDALPETMTVPAGTEYIIVSNCAADGTVTREVFGRESEYINSDRVREDGFVIRKLTELVWE